LRKLGRGKSRVPTGSAFYDKIIPLLLVGMAVVTVIFILFAVGVLLGLVPYQ
jgi:hypothetical protein